MASGGASSDYCCQLRVWLAQVHQARCMEAMFPIWLSQQLASSGVPPPSQGAAQQRPAAGAANQAAAAAAAAAAAPAAPARNDRGIEYRIPPLWKRFVAETIDFIILIVVKFALAYVAIDQFGLLDLSKYDMDTLVRLASGAAGAGSGGNSGSSSYSLALELTSELFMLELLNRLSVCWFEALFLRRSWGGRGDGGATPGKYLVGVRVVRCDWVAPSLHDHVLLAPGGDVGLARALLRSAIKNISTTFFLNMLAAVFYLDHNRMPYDLLAGTIVVETARH